MTLDKFLRGIETVAVITTSIAGTCSLISDLSSKNERYAVRDHFDREHEERICRIREQGLMSLAKAESYSNPQHEYTPQYPSQQSVQPWQPSVQQPYTATPVYAQPYGYPMQIPVQYAQTPPFQQGQVVFQQPVYNYPSAIQTVTMTTNDLVSIITQAFIIGQNNQMQQPVMHTSL